MFVEYTMILWLVYTLYSDEIKLINIQLNYILISLGLDLNDLLKWSDNILCYQHLS